MNEENLKNLARLGHLKAEPADARECAGLLASARERLLDARVGSLSFAGRFDLAYNAAHAAALTALRRAGYRTDKRYFVFQCLGSTSSLSKTDIRILALCHERRNLAEYEGYLDADEALLATLLTVTDRLLAQLDAG